MSLDKLLLLAMVLLASALEAQELEEVVVDVRKKLERTRYSKDLIPPVLPNPGKNDDILLIDKSNISYFYDLILPQMASWVKDGWFVMTGLSRTKYDWTYGENWNSEGAFKNIARIDKEASIVGPAILGQQKGFIFGRAEELNKQTDSVEKARRILWNSATLGGVSKHSIYDLKISWFNYETRVRKAKALFVRQVAAIGDLFDAKNNKKLLQESFSILAPPVVTGYTQILNRFFGIQDDDIWFYSPVIEAGRKLLHANRGDSIFESVLSMDDFFVWSGKVQQVNAKVLDEREVFVPVPRLSYFSLTQEKVSLSAVELVKGESLKIDELDSADTEGADTEGVDTGVIKPKPLEKVFSINGNIPDAEGGNSFVVWNNESRKFAEAASWLPTSVKFVPRKTWVLELTPRDPYYPGGRVLLYVDQESMLPLYKVNFSVDGEYLKTVMGVWTFVNNERANVNYPVLASLLVVDDHKNAIVIDTESVKFVEEKSDHLAKELPKMFNPEEFLDIVGPPKEEESKENTEVKETTKTEASKQASEVPSPKIENVAKPVSPVIENQEGLENSQADTPAETLSKKKVVSEDSKSKKIKTKAKPASRPLWDQDEF